MVQERFRTTDRNGFAVSWSASMLRYWHPVLNAAELRRGAVVPLIVAGREIALFRTADGSVGAVEDQCAHRRMKLSRGRVSEDRLICPYHGWSYRASGEGQSPTTPRVHACIPSYESREEAGAIWIRSRESSEPLHVPAVSGMSATGAVFHTVHAPLELVMDNFSEVEHTLAMHPDFGFDPARAEEATVALECTADSVTARSSGPAKQPPFDTRVSGGIRQGDRFHSDFTFQFDPPRSSVHHYWIDRTSDFPRPLEYRLVHYFVPRDARTTTIVTFGFLAIRRRVFSLFARPTLWMFRRKLARTVAEDAGIVEHLADQSVGLEGMRLGRFDSILGMTRERVARIYFGICDD